MFFGVPQSQSAISRRQIFVKIDQVLIEHLGRAESCGPDLLLRGLFQVERALHGVSDACADNDSAVAFEQCSRSLT